MIYVFIALLLVRAFKGFLKWVLIAGLVAWGFYKHPEAFTQAGELLENADRQITQLIDRR